MSAGKSKSAALLEELETLRRRVEALDRAEEDRRPLRERLERAERRLREAQQVARLGFWEWDIAANTLAWSEGLYRIFGLKPSEFTATFEGFLERVHPDDRAATRATIERSRTEGDGFEHDTRILRPDGTLVHLHSRGETVRDAAGAVVRMIGTGQDVTERRRAEAEDLRARKLESIGVLAGGIAHDFNNLLTVILGNVLLLKAGTEPADPEHARLADAESACLRARNLTQQILTFAEGGAPVTRPVALGAVLDEAGRAVPRSEAIRVERRLPADLWPLEADATQLGHVLAGLAMNAVQAMPEGGTLRIRAENVRADGPGRGRRAGPPGRLVRIIVEDEGIGIPADHLPRIFDPFFSTRQGRSGLGLATAYSIVTRHGGTIRATSSPGHGATFILELPAAQDPPAAPAAPAPAAPPVEARAGAAETGGMRRILVMDDEAPVLQMIGDLLRHFGHEPVLAGDGARAVELYAAARQEGRPFDAVILDLTVPGGLGGREAMRRLLEIDPGTRGIIASGYSNDPVMAEHRRHGFLGVVRKPFRMEELRAVLAAVLVDRTADGG
jgi:PAS domain S-box-containing protein